MSFEFRRGEFPPEHVVLSRWAALLRCAFPEAVSEHDLCVRVARTLSRRGRRVTERAVRNWLRGENAPHFRYVLTVLALAGAEAAFRVLDPEER
jgi:hypothetical protein